jgi:hypothetical protein
MRYCAINATFHEPQQQGLLGSATIRVGARNVPMINRRNERIDDAGDIFVSHCREHGKGSRRSAAACEFIRQDTCRCRIVGDVEDPLDTTQPPALEPRRDARLLDSAHERGSRHRKLGS